MVLFIRSPATRDLVNSGKAKVIGAIYDVGSGKVRWLPEEKTGAILKIVEASPAWTKEAMAGECEAH